MSLSPETVEALLCLRSWYRAGLLENVNVDVFIREIENASVDDIDDEELTYAHMQCNTTSLVEQIIVCSKGRVKPLVNPRGEPRSERGTNPPGSPQEPDKDRGMNHLPHAPEAQFYLNIVFISKLIQIRFRVGQKRIPQVVENGFLSVL
ncbi:hypothetical protein OUZ56_029905 [Daphnia magna]|uniref:HAT C-terminal dimerisation domain-containing protein n=1 Tax=Daphnia magna TaxID=35525 RepID=A0ABR0B886_9CRUS|nr:hypothetical protein OUZ56_029905 [Daphnia magna]